MLKTFISLALTAALVAGVAPAAATTAADGPVVTLAPTGGAEPIRDALPIDQPDDELVVTYRAGTPVAVRSAARAHAGVGVVERDRELEVVRVPAADRAEAVEDLLADPAVLAVEPNMVFTATGIPNDQDFGEQWGLENTGQFGFGTPGADIGAPAAWDVATGSSTVTVAIVDSGMDLDHPDLAGRLWVNAADPVNGIDDDGNGYVDDRNGWDWVGEDRLPNDPNGHGTHVAGIIGAQANNGVGVSGVAWDVRLMPLRVLSAKGGGFLSDITAAFRYAGKMGADVVNASLGAFGPEPKALRAAIAAYPKTLFVVAAGNGSGDGDLAGDDNDALPTWPCNHTLPNVICVTASDEDDLRAPWANVGRRSVDLSAPGVDVLSTLPAADGSYAGALSLTDSPGGLYANDSDAWVQRDAPIDLSTSSGCSLSLRLMLETEYTYPPGADDDWLRVEASDGGPWTKVLSVTGSTKGEFRSFTPTMSAFEGKPNVQIRFRLQSDEAVVYDGAHIDNVDVTCSTNDPGMAVETFDAGLGGWTVGGTGHAWGTTDAANEYEYLAGTSMASPFVAGAAAVLWSQRPGGVTKTVWSEHVRNVLRAGVDPARPWMASKTAWGGRLDLAAALAVTGDLTPPTRATLQPVGDRFSLNRRISVSASATDGETGVGSYEHRVRTATHRGSFSSARLWRSGGASPTYTGALGRTHCFTSRALDGARNAGPGSALSCTAIPFNERSLDRYGRWKQVRPDGAYRGTALRSSTRGARLVLRGVKARQIALVATTCRRCGKVGVFRGSQRLTVIDLGRRSGNSVLLNVARFGRVLGPSAITIKVLTRGKPVLIEGLGISRV